MINVVVAITHGNLGLFYVHFYVIFVTAIFILKQYKFTFSDSEGSNKFNERAAYDRMPIKKH